MVPNAAAVCTGVSPLFACKISYITINFSRFLSLLTLLSIKIFSESQLLKQIINENEKRNLLCIKCISINGGALHNDHCCKSAMCIDYTYYNFSYISSLMHNKKPLP